MRTKRVLRAAVAFLFAFGVLAADLTPLRLPPQTASAVTQADIDKLKKESNALSSKKSEVNKQLSALKKDKANTLKRKALLDQQIDLISEEIANTEQQIAQYEALIEQTEQELSETQAQEADQYELFCKRVRAMEERGTVSYWSVLFQSSSFEELLGAMDFISEVMEADQRVIDDLRVLQAQIAEKQQTLETSLAEQQSAKEALAVKNNELRDQRTEATGLIKEMEENEADYKDVLAEIEAEEEKTQKEIVRLSKELAAQQGNTTVTYGGYIWPVTTSKRVTSPFGKRNTGIKGASTNHRGIDIGDVAGGDVAKGLPGGRVSGGQGFPGLRGDEAPVDKGLARQGELPGDGRYVVQRVQLTHIASLQRRSDVAFYISDHRFQLRFLFFIEILQRRAHRAGGQAVQLAAVADRLHKLATVEEVHQRHHGGHDFAAFGEIFFHHAGFIQRHVFAWNEVRTSTDPALRAPGEELQRLIVPAAGKRDVRELAGQQVQVVEIPGTLFNGDHVW